MANKWLLISFYLSIILYQIKSHESLLQCWRCEVTVQSSEQHEVFLGGMCSFSNWFHIYIDVYKDCQAEFDFTQHTREDCNGKCWKSVDLIDPQQFENNTQHQSSLLKDAALSKLKSSRRCFSANELVRAAEMGVNTSDGCRQVKRNDRKIKAVCFCSDQDMCNSAFQLTKHFFIVFSSLFLVYLNK
jgi:hypothetical protein